MIAVIGFLLFFSQDTCHERYVEQLMHTQSGDYFMVVKAIKNSKKINIILTNNDLKFNLEKKGLPWDESIKNKILQEDTVLLVDKDVRYWGIATDNKKINKIKSKGKEYFLNYFFDENGFLKMNKKVKVHPQIFKVLFDWNIFAGEAEGTMFIDKKKTVCN